MKTKLSILITLFFIAASICASAQIVDPKEETEKESTKRVNQKIDKGVDKGLDKIEEGIGSLFGKKKKKKKNAEQTEKQQANQNNHEQQSEGGVYNAAQAEPTLNWAKYDFVSGDKVIFEDNLEREENGEFPSRWDLVKGTTENAELGGDNVIMFRGGSPMIVPYLKDSDKDYLPDVFTVEFDLYMNNHNYFEVYFYDKKNQRISSQYKALAINYQEMNISPAKSRIPNNGNIENQWAHIAIAYTNGKFKAYINETRLINIPRLDFEPMGISLYAYHASDHNQFYVKNFRIAEGGVKYYERFLQDGKIVATGIRFDVNKATLRPESMGIINEIFNLMNDNPDINFSIEGHTDSDGDETSNQLLSKNRAQTVMNTLVSMGIAKNRLSAKGWGESMPIHNNTTPEGKANNRRVEFIKM